METPEEAEQSALIKKVMRSIERDRGLVESKDDEGIKPTANMLKDIAKYDKKWYNALGTHRFPTVVPGMKDVLQDRRAPAIVVLKALIILTMGDVASDGSPSQEKRVHVRFRENWNKVALESVGLCKDIYKSSFEQCTLRGWDHWLTNEKHNRSLENLDSSDDEEPEKPAKKKQKRVHHGGNKRRHKTRDDQIGETGDEAGKKSRDKIISVPKQDSFQDEGVHLDHESVVHDQNQHGLKAVESHSLQPLQPAKDSSSDDDSDDSDGSNDGWLTAPLPKMHYETNSYQREMIARNL